ncbi:MAG: hypothetical protein J6A47_05595 [Bacilli bacterium]|nr:hypothetical protein [Bacilli bacterium]MBO6285157.1 hypothetical protein [Bacilli bacterium]
MKKLRLFVLIGGIAAILIAIGIFSLVSYLNYESYRKAAQAGVGLIQFLR